jgi:hypothetical protein
MIYQLSTSYLRPISDKIVKFLVVISSKAFLSDVMQYIQILKILLTYGFKKAILFIYLLFKRVISWDDYRFQSNVCKCA